MIGETMTGIAADAGRIKQKTISVIPSWSYLQLTSSISSFPREGVVAREAHAEAVTVKVRE